MNKPLNAYQQLKDIVGLSILSRTDTLIKFAYKNMRVKFYINSEFYTGQNIEQGKGLDDLIEKLSKTY